LATISADLRTTFLRSSSAIGGTGIRSNPDIFTGAHLIGPAQSGLHHVAHREIFVTAWQNRRARANAHRSTRQVAAPRQGINATRAPTARGPSAQGGWRAAPLPYRIGGQGGRVHAAARQPKAAFTALVPPGILQPGADLSTRPQKLHGDALQGLVHPSHSSGGRAGGDDAAAHLTLGAPKI